MQIQPMNLRAFVPNKNVKSLLASTINVWPNPAFNQLKLLLENATINIFDALGQTIYQASANIKAGKLTIDISTLAKGMYHIQLLSASNKSLSTSFIKQ